MKSFLIIVFFILFTNCSFDNKTGIWENEKTSRLKDNKIFKDFKKISISENIFKETISLKNNFFFDIPDPITNLQWSDIFYSHDNNYKNFKYNNSNNIYLKSKKITKNLPNYHILYIDRNLIISDNKGNLIIFSIDDDKIISKFNFYKNKFKRIEKKLNIIVENKVIYVADNLGYVYAYDRVNKKISWAKNYKVPFSSNLKIYKNKLIVSNQNNTLYILDKNNGNILKLIPTEETYIKNKFENNLSSDGNGKLFFLNSFGSIYSINLNDLELMWFNNINQSLDLTPSNLFFGNKIVNTEKQLIISSNTKTYLIDINTGSIVKKFNFASVVKPIIINDIVYFLTDNNFLIALDLQTKKIILSNDLTKIQETEILNTKKNIYKEIMMLNNNIFIFLENSKVLELSAKGKFITLFKLPSKITSSPISIENSIAFLSKKRFIIVN